MQKNNWAILSTRPLSESLVQNALAKGFAIDCRSFIETEPVKSEAVAEKIKTLSGQKATVVFTSMNAVDAIAGYIETKPAWRIYAIGNSTKELSEKYLNAVFETADNAGALADKIIANGEKAVTFFCGDARRDELPQKLSEARIGLDEVIVYRTHSLPQKIEKPYDAVLFFSPSAAHAFFDQNNLPPQTVLFAIGETTAAALNTYTNNRIYVADSPSKEALVQDMMDFFGNLKTNQ